MTYNKYEKEFKEKIVRLHLEEGRTIKSLNQEYSLGKGTISYWMKQLREECQSNSEVKQTKEVYDQTLELRKKIAELEKENEFLKKAAAFFAKEIK